MFVKSEQASNCEYFAKLWLDSIIVHSVLAKRFYAKVKVLITSKLYTTTEKNKEKLKTNKERYRSAILRKTDISVHLLNSMYLLSHD